MFGHLRSVVSLVALLAFAAAAAAQPAAQPRPAQPPAGIVGSLPVPGGIDRLARVAGIDGGGPRGLALLEIIRVIHEVEPGVDRRLDARRARLFAYLSAIAAFERARAGLPGGLLSRRLAGERPNRAAIDRFAEAIGSRVEPGGGAIRIVPDESAEARSRRQSLKEAGFDIATFATRFDAGEDLRPELASDEVPLPIPAPVWETIAPPDPEMAGSLVATLVASRRLSLLYYGLASMDPATRGLLGSSPPHVKQLLYAARSGALASRGRSLFVRDGRIQVPGGEAAVPAWQSLVGVKTTNPQVFIWLVLGGDAGRLALFYDTLAHLEEPSLRFALGLSVEIAVADRPQQRTAHLAALYRAFAPSMTGWDSAARPFARTVNDAAQVLMTARVTDDGRALVAGGRRFWRFVFRGASIPRDRSDLPDDLDRDEPLDSVSLIDLLCPVDTAARLHRVAAWQFAQRVFAGNSPSSLVDVAIALRGFQPYRLLLATLERMGIRDPAVYALSVRCAEELTRLGDDERRRTALAQFQGALAIIERARFARMLEAGAAAGLVSSLSRLSITPGGEYRGAVAAWIDAALVPSLAPATSVPMTSRDLGRPIEAQVLAAIAGSRAQSGPPATVEWEGLRYRVDVAAAEYDRMVRIRLRQGGASLDAALKLGRALRQLTEAGGAKAGLSAALAETAALLAQVETDLDAEPEPGRPGSVRQKWRDAARDARRSFEKSTNVDSLRGAIAGLGPATDGLLASVLASLAYAPHLGDPDGPALLAGDPASRHDFGAKGESSERRAAAAWEVPEERTGASGGWKVVGSLLGLDLGLSRLSLKRIATDSLAVPPTVSENDRDAIAESAVLLNPFDLTDEGKIAIAEALKRGADRVNSLASNRSDLQEIVRLARVGEWRREALAWSLEREPARVPEYFSALDLFRVGTTDPATAPSLDPWGGSQYSFEGCLGLRFPSSVTWENYTGMTGRILVLSRANDLVLRVAHTLAELGLPARLARAMMAYATQDVIDLMRPPTSDDWATLVASVRRITRARMEDYVAALTMGGPLIPAARGGI